MFDFVESVRSQRACECTPDLFRRVIDSREVASVCAEIADAREACSRGEMGREDFDTFKAESKKRLPAFCFQAHFGGDGRRLNKNAVASGLCIYDKDHVADPEGWFAERVKPNVEAWQVVLAHKTPSGEGVRLVFRVAKGVSLADAQYSLSRALGDDDYDGSVKDTARASFAVPRDYILYVDMEGLFAPTPSDYAMPFEVVSASGVAKRSVSQKTKKEVEAQDKRWKTKRPTERTMRIVERGMEKRGITKEALRREGQRHYMLANLLSTGITRLLTKEELMGAVKKLAPAFAREDDCWRLVDDWYRNYRNDMKPVSQDMALTFADLLGEEKKEDKSEETEAPEPKPTKPDFTMSIDDLPAGFGASLRGVPDNLRMPVLCAILPLCGAYADQVEVRYADGKRHRLGLMSIIVGEQASKKSACKDVVDIWKRQMHEDDMVQRRLEDEWKQRRKNRKANEKGEPDPQVLIREIPVTTSCSTLLKRLKNSREHCLYSFGEELDTLRKTNGAGSWSAKYDVYRLSFDRGEWGQDYNSDQAESGMVKVAYNWTILGTYGALHKCFGKGNIENGLSSRVMVAEMPDNRFAPMTTFADPTPEDDELIQQSVDTLRSASGFLDTPRLREWAAEWVEEKRVEASQSIDVVKDTYRKRACVIAFRCGVIFALLAGGESDVCIAFARMMGEYVLREQCRLFGEGLEEENGSSKPECKSNENILTSLPREFTMDDLRALKGKGFPDGTYRMIISRWRREGWIEKQARGVWRKC